MFVVVDMCQVWNGGCAKGAKCSQKGDQVSCSCPKSHSGDGFTCQPIDPCVSGDNGGCHEHATCTLMAPVRTQRSSFCRVTTQDVSSANVMYLDRGRRSAAVRTTTSETESAVSSDSCQSAAVSKTTDNAIKRPNVPTSTLKVKRFGQI